MPWDLIRMVGGFIFGAVLLGLLVKLRKFMEVEVKTEEETEGYIESVKDTSVHAVEDMDDEELLTEWGKEVDEWKNQ